MSEMEPSTEFLGSSAPPVVDLDDPTAAWQVEAGSVVVYVQRHGERSGRRRLLLEAESGHVLFGAARREDTGFVAVASEGAVVHRLTSEERRSVLEQPSGPATSWVEALSRFAIHTGRPTPPGGFADLSAMPPGDSWWTEPGRLDWVRVSEGRVRLCGSENGELDPSSPAIPVADVWLTAVEPSRMNFAADLTRQDRDAGLAWLHEHILKVHGEHEARSGHALSDREQLRRESGTRHLYDAVQELAQPFGADAPLPPTDDELMAALAAVGRKLKVSFQRPPRQGGGWADDELDAIAQASGVRSRPVKLSGNWWQSDGEPLLASLIEGDQERPVALISEYSEGYQLFDPRVGELRPLTAEVRRNLRENAFSFYRPLIEPTRSLWKILTFGFGPYARDLRMGLYVGLVATLLGMLVPIATKLVIDEALPDANYRMLIEIAAVLVAVGIGQSLMHLVQSIASVRLMVRGTALLQAATWDRLFRLPVSFFRQFSSGDLVHRGTMVSTIGRSLGATALSSVLTAALSVFNLALMFYFSSALTGYAVIFAVIEAAIVAWIGMAVRRRSLLLERLRGQLIGFVVQLILGISKLRVAGAESRAFHRWAKPYAEQLRLTIVVRRLYDIQRLIDPLLPGMVTIIFYLLARTYWIDAESGQEGALTAGSLVGFLTAYRMFSSGLTSLGELAMEIMHSMARQRLAEPILTEPLESQEAHATPTALQGEISVDRLSFRYFKDGPLVLQDVSLRVRPGEFVAIVGPSGSGKSTLLRLLLGFEQPTEGTVRYDGRDLQGLHLPSVRRQVGCVMQSAILISGSIFDNITAGHLVGLDEVLQAAHDAEFDRDLAEMPMGVHTMVSERGTNLSGGQRQRLMLARALVHQPRVLLLDEATSALDEAIQARVMENLVRRKVTRVVIAHRLSTVRMADRIYVLERGRVVQSGNFDELMAQPGLFERLVRRQQV